jgi:hypothetical protein
MKHLVARTLISILLGVLALGPTAHAQHTERTIKANIPFEFSVGDQTFPAGNYWLVNSAPAFLQLRDAQGRTLATVLTSPVQALNTPASPKLRFTREGGRYALAQVWQENYSTGQQLPSPKALTKTAKRQSGQTQTIATSDAQ